MVGSDATAQSRPAASPTALNRPKQSRAKALIAGTIARTVRARRDESLGSYSPAGQRWPGPWAACRGDLWSSGSRSPSSPLAGAHEFVARWEERLSRYVGYSVELSVGIGLRRS